MAEPEIQSLVALVGSGGEIVHPLLGRHGIPLVVPLLVPENIVCLHQAVKRKVHAEDGKQLLVSALVQRCVV